jgi:hypothetical protein
MDQAGGNAIARRILLVVALIATSWGALVTLAVLSVLLPNDALPPILLAVWLLAILGCIAIGERKWRSWLWLPLVPPVQLFLVIRSWLVRRG